MRREKLFLKSLELSVHSKNPLGGALFCNVMTDNLCVVFVPSFRRGAVWSTLRGNEAGRNDSHSRRILLGHVSRELA